MPLTDFLLLSLSLKTLFPFIFPFYQFIFPFLLLFFFYESFSSPTFSILRLDFLPNFPSIRKCLSRLFSFSQKLIHPWLILTLGDLFKTFHVGIFHHSSARPSFCENFPAPWPSCRCFTFFLLLRFSHNRSSQAFFRPGLPVLNSNSS